MTDTDTIKMDTHKNKKDTKLANKRGIQINNRGMETQFIIILYLS